MQHDEAARREVATRAALAVVTGYPATPKYPTLVELAESYLRTAANFAQQGFLKESYMEAEHAQRLLMDAILQQAQENWNVLPRRTS